MNVFRSSAVGVLLFAVGCSSSIGTPAPLPTGSAKPPPGNSMQHVIIMLQENRSFNNLFMSYPGAETSTTGLCKTYRLPHPYRGTICKDPSKPVVLHERSLQECHSQGCFDLAHSHADFESEVDEDPVTHLLKMDGFDTISLGTNGGLGPAKFDPYAYVPS